MASPLWPVVVGSRLTPRRPDEPHAYRSYSRAVRAHGDRQGTTLTGSAVGAPDDVLPTRHRGEAVSQPRGGFTRTNAVWGSPVSLTAEQLRGDACVFCKRAFMPGVPNTRETTPTELAVLYALRDAKRRPNRNDIENNVIGAKGVPRAPASGRCTGVRRCKPDHLVVPVGIEAAG